MARILSTMCLAGALLAAPALAGPGDPFGGDDTGCAPSTSLGLGCAKKVAVAIHKLRRSVLRCQLDQAELAFQTGMSSPGFDNAKENCEVGNPSNSAKAKFDNRIAGLVGNGCDATVIANANATRDQILGDQNTAGSLDNLNGVWFCDSTSGAFIADTSGSDQDEAGWIPASPQDYKCAFVIAKLWSKLDFGVLKCHLKLANAVYKNALFDEDACEDIGLKSQLTRYNDKANKLILGGYCAPCLASGAPTLGISTVAGADANLEDVYICPGP